MIRLVLTNIAFLVELSGIADGITIEGWHSYHQLEFVPQIAALSDSEIRDGLLCSPEYWQSDRVERRDD